MTANENDHTGAWKKFGLRWLLAIGVVVALVVGLIGSAQAETNTIGDWVTGTGKSKIDDTPSAFLFTRSQETVGRPGREDYVGFHLRCQEKTTSLILKWPMYLHSQALLVTTRIDEKPARTAAWNVSTSRDAAGLWYGSASIPVIKELMQAKLLTVRLTPYGESSYTVTFKVEKLRDLVGPLRQACQW